MTSGPPTSYEEPVHEILTKSPSSNVLYYPCNAGSYLSLLQNFVGKQILMQKELGENFCCREENCKGKTSYYVKAGKSKQVGHTLGESKKVGEMKEVTRYIGVQLFIKYSKYKLFQPLQGQPVQTPPRLLNVTQSTLATQTAVGRRLGVQSGCRLQHSWTRTAAPSCCSNCK